MHDEEFAPLLPLLVTAAPLSWLGPVQYETLTVPYCTDKGASYRLVAPPLKSPPAPASITTLSLALRSSDLVYQSPLIRLLV